MAEIIKKATRESFGMTMTFGETCQNLQQQVFRLIINMTIVVVLRGRIY